MIDKLVVGAKVVKLDGHTVFEITHIDDKNISYDIYNKNAEGVLEFQIDNWNYPLSVFIEGLDFHGPYEIHPPEIKSESPKGPRDKNGVELKVGMTICQDDAEDISDAMIKMLDISTTIKLGKIVEIKEDPQVGMMFAYADGSFNPKNPIKHWACKVIKHD